MLSFRNMHFLQYTTEKTLLQFFLILHHNKRNQGMNI